MRCIAAFENEERGRQFLVVLQERGIDAVIDREENRIEVWVKSEDEIASATALLEQFEEGKEYTVPIKKVEEREKPVQKIAKPILLIAPLNRFLLLICSVIFLVALYQTFTVKQVDQTIFMPLPKVAQDLLYDYPMAYAIAEQLGTEYEVTAKTDVAALPTAAQGLVQDLRNHPPWEGFYTILTQWKHRERLWKGPILFEDLRRGEVWRLFTPAILHINVLHFLFNMLWLWLLGRMVEHNVGPIRFLGLVIGVAVVTNTLQYLMTGPMFMGISGVIAAMGGYIWVRKQVAPWEVYPVDRGTLIFLGVFIFGMLALQGIAFFLEILHIVSFPLGIANTAHVSGVLLGMVLGRVVKRKA